MLEKIFKVARKDFEEKGKKSVFEIGSNSDLILENTITNNLVWTIENFKNNENGKLTFPTKFDMVDPILQLDHKGKVIIRVSVNPEEIINRVEFGTSRLNGRIEAINKLKEAGYEIGILIIFMTYSYVHTKINGEAFPNAINLYEKDKMTGRGRGKYWYKENIREEGKKFFLENMKKYFPNNEILYIV